MNSTRFDQFGYEAPVVIGPSKTRKTGYGQHHGENGRVYEITIRYRY